jgi:predicted nucleotidyltransferase
LQTILRSLQRLLRLFKEKNVSYMIIGGYALPFYGRIRATVDLDLAVAIKTKEELDRLRGWLKSADFEVTVNSYLNPVLVVLDKKEKLEIQLWLRPDGITFDEELLKRRRKMELDKGFEAWVISPEDFIVNKLARPDRGAVDEQDIKSVLVRQKNRLDKKYLEKRAQDAGVLTAYKIIEAA